MSSPGRVSPLKGSAYRPSLVCSLYSPSVRRRGFWGETTAVTTPTKRNAEVSGIAVSEVKVNLACRKPPSKPSFAPGVIVDPTLFKRLIRTSAESAAVEEIISGG